MIVMNKGKIEQIGTPEDIYRLPATQFVAGFVGSPPMNLLKATVIDCSTVKIDDQLIRVPQHDVAIGSVVIVGIRPEHVEMDDNAGNNVFSIDFIEDMGSLRLLHGKLGGHDFVVQSLSGATQQLGQFKVRIASDKIHLFDVATGLRLQI